MARHCSARLAATLTALVILAGPHGTAGRKPRRREPAPVASAADSTPTDEGHLRFAQEQTTLARGASGASVRELLDGSMQHVVDGLSDSPSDFALLNLAVTNLYWKGWKQEPGRSDDDRAEYCERARASFTAAEKGRMSLPEMRYFFTICCDDARRYKQGGATARGACFLEAGVAGIWPREYQVRSEPPLSRAILRISIEMAAFLVQLYCFLLKQLPFQ